MKALLLAAASALLAGLPAAAGPVVFQPFPGGGALAPGRVVEVRWSGVPAGVDEMELLLSLDGGRHFPVRVTPDVDADQGAYRWVVPPLPTSDARLAVRIDQGGREVLAGVSAPFRIAAGAETHALATRRRNGELWSALEGTGDPVAEPGGWSPAAPDRRLDHGPASAAWLAPPAPRAVRPRLTVALAGAPRLAASRPAAVPAGGAPRGAPRPLRI